MFYHVVSLVLHEVIVVKSPYPPLVKDKKPHDGIDVRPRDGIDPQAWKVQSVTDRGI